ncbi:MAG: hypothetical protein U1E97_02425 [Alphaproteobacteria bacterium]
MTEFGTILLSLGILAIVFLGRTKHQAHPPKWVLNPMMNMLVWIPFIAALVGIVIVFDSILGSHGEAAGIGDEIVSIVIFGGAVVLSVILHRRGAPAKA